LFDRDSRCFTRAREGINKFDPNKVPIYPADVSAEKEGRWVQAHDPNPGPDSMLGKFQTESIPQKYKKIFRFFGLGGMSDSRSGA
jgi:hypothetical protein